MSQDLKTTLKDVRQLIQSSDYAAALTKCKEVLSIDADNYTSLVFAGRCATEVTSTKEAETFYKRATVLSPSNVLAWQGLAQLYDKTDNVSKDAVPVYKNVSQLLPSGDPRLFDINLKLAICLALNGQVDEALEILCNQQLRASENPVRQVSFDNAVIRALKREKLTSSNAVKLVEDAFERAIEAMKESSVAEDDFGRETVSDFEFKVLQFLDFLIKNDCGARAIEVFRTYCKEFSNAVPKLLELILSTYIKKGSLSDLCVNISQDEFLGWAIDLCVDTEGYELDEKMLSAIEHILNSDWNSAQELLIEAESDVSNSLSVFLNALLGEAYLSQRNFWEAVKHFSRCAVNSEASPLFGCNRVRIAFAEALQGQNSSESLEKAVQLYQIALFDAQSSELSTAQKINITEKIFCAHLQRSDISNAQMTLKQLQQLGASSGRISCAEGWLMFSKHKFDEALKLLQESLEKDEPAADVHYFLGRTLWAKEEVPKALAAFLQYAKREPYSSETWFFLGLCYNALSNDLLHVQKAMKCFLRSHQLNSHNLETIRELSSVYRSLCELGQDMHQENLELLMRVKDSYGPSRCKWAWFELGVEFLSTQQHDNAAHIFQLLLNCYPDDALCWECLADAYKARGSYDSAINAYEKVLQIISPDIAQNKRKMINGKLLPSSKETGLELPDTVLYALYQVASIKLILQFYDDAIDHFKRILVYKKDYIPAMLGVGEALVYLGRSYQRQVRLERAVQHYKDAVRYLSKVAKLKPDLVLCFKLLGDALTVIYNIPEHLLLVLTDISQKFDTVPFQLYGIKHSLLVLGSRFYLKSLTLQPSQTSLWHDLALNFHYQSELLKLMKESDVSEEELLKAEADRKKRPTNVPVTRSPMDMAFVLSRKAMELVKRALVLEPKNAKYWSTLGVVAASAKLPSLAQHCFIKSLRIEGRNAVVWTNLGILYFHHDNITLAYQCFKQAQAADPDFPNCWTAQSLIAEKLSHHDTMDLFRHSAQLGFVPQAIIGYAHHVVKLLTDGSINRNSYLYCYGIKELFAVPIARDMMSKYTVLKPLDIFGWNCLGLLQEADYLLKSSLNSLERALDLAVGSTELMSQIRINLFRVCVKLRDSTRVKKLAGKLETQNLSFQALKALMFYRLEEYDQAIEVLNQSEYYAKTPDETEELRFAVLLALTKQRLLGKAEVDLTSQWTATRLGTQIAAILAHLATGVLSLPAIKGLIHSLTLDKDRNVDLWLCLLCDVVSSVEQNNNCAATTATCHLIHAFPDIADVWSTLTSTLLLAQKQQNLAERARKASRLLKKVALTKKDLLIFGHYRNSKQVLLKIRHMFPA